MIHLSNNREMKIVSVKLKEFIKKHTLLLYFARKIRTIKKPIKKLLFKLIDKKTDDQNLMINIGGGEYIRRHWRVLDYPTQWYNHTKVFIDYCFDLMTNKPLPFSDNSVAFFYSAHTLEHIPQEFCQHIFDEIYRCLKNGGAIRITMPDFDLAYSAFGKNDIDFFVKYPGENIEEKFLDYFATYMEDKVSREELRKRYNSMEKEEFADFYTQQIPRDYHFVKITHSNHISWWNYEKLERMLAQAGFKNIYRSTAQRSRFSEMRGVGRDCGFDSTHPELSLFVEAVK